MVVPIDHRTVRRLAVDIRQLLAKIEVLDGSDTLDAAGLMKSLGSGFQIAALGCALRPDIVPSASFVGALLDEFRSESRLMPLVAREVVSLLERGDLSDVIVIANEWAQAVSCGETSGTSNQAVADRIIRTLLEALGVSAITPVENPLEQIGLRVARIIDLGLTYYGGNLAGGLDRDDTRTVLATLIEGAVNTATFYLYRHSSLELNQIGNAAVVVPYLFGRSEAEQFVAAVLPKWNSSGPRLGPAASIELYGNLWTVEHGSSFEPAVRGLVDYAHELQGRQRVSVVLH